MTRPRIDTDAVLRWGLPRLRDLPWRSTRDPWSVLVSEVMLQQTQASRVIPKWLAFLDAFPTPEVCAEAPLGDVLRLWQGLGYPRRARNLHAAAAEVHRLGEFPCTLEGLLALPGVGAYTARAVLAFAFESDAAVVDTNIARVFARVQGHALRPKEVQMLADAASPAGRSWDWNQCLMDLGAVLCRPASPGCAACPLRTLCAWCGQGPDPAVDSAGVSRRQARFDGSDRQARGRLMKALSSGSVPLSAIAGIVQRDEREALHLAEALIGERLCALDGEMLRLP